MNVGKGWTASTRFRHVPMRDTKQLVVVEEEMVKSSGFVQKEC